MLEALFDELGIPRDYSERRGWPAYPEAEELVEVGPNVIGRVQRLTPRAARQWRAMRAAAAMDGIELLLVSGFRGIEYQAELIRNKLAAGKSIEEILAVNAAPGYSEHHTGEAIDLATPGCRPLTEAFEDTPAFDWLGRWAGKFGYRLSYPRDNPQGFVYEPWHWALEKA